MGEEQKRPAFINARAETVAEKPAFRTAFRQRRCLILADGYYEWQTVGKTKQPYFIRRGDDRPFGFAGLWESRAEKDGTALESCTIITTTANERTRFVHDRMPVIVDPGEWDAWLAPEAAPGDAAAAFCDLIRRSCWRLIR